MHFYWTQGHSTTVPHLQPFSFFYFESDWPQNLQSCCLILPSHWYYRHIPDSMYVILKLFTQLRAVAWRQMQCSLFCELKHTGQEGSAGLRRMEKKNPGKPFRSCQMALWHGDYDYSNSTHDAIAESCQKSCEWLPLLHQKAQPISTGETHYRWHLRSGCHRMSNFTVSHLYPSITTIPKPSFSQLPIITRKT